MHCSVLSSRDESSFMCVDLNTRALTMKKKTREGGGLLKTETIHPGGALFEGDRLGRPRIVPSRRHGQS
jgi:hypothetical protein